MKKKQFIKQFRTNQSTKHNKAFTNNLRNPETNSKILKNDKLRSWYLAVLAHKFSAHQHSLKQRETTDFWILRNKLNSQNHPGKRRIRPIQIKVRLELKIKCKRSLPSKQDIAAENKFDRVKSSDQQGCHNEKIKQLNLSVQWLSI